jgi:hypothetical protein
VGGVDRRHFEQRLGEFQLRRWRGRRWQFRRGRQLRGRWWRGELVRIVTKVLIEMIGDAGYVVSFTYDDDARPVVTAVNERTRETFIVRHEDLYHAACELAEQVGIDVEDG